MTEEQIKIVNLARRKHLTAEQTIFLLALRIVKGGVTGNEFNVLDVQNTTLEKQTNYVIDYIIADEKRWQDYVRGGDGVIYGKPLDFISFFALRGGPYKNGWSDKPLFSEKIKTKMKEIRNGS